MAISKYITKEMLIKAAKKMGKIFYDEVIYPAAKTIVDNSSNSYDDMMLAFLDDLADDFFNKKEDEAVDPIEPAKA